MVGVGSIKVVSQKCDFSGVVALIKRNASGGVPSHPIDYFTTLDTGLIF